MLLLRSAAIAACFLAFSVAVQAQVVLPDAEWCATPPLPLGKTGVGETDSPVVRALLVFVRFRDDDLNTSIPGWPATPDRHTLPPIGTTLLAPTQATITASDSSFSRYYYDQSRASVSSPGTLQYFGDVWPRNTAGQPEVYVTKQNNAWYHSTNGKGYGHLTKEILDSLVTQPGFDIGNYDTNSDGILDELILLIRTDYQQNSRGGNSSFTYSGCAMLDGCTFINTGRPSGTLAYTSPSQSRTVEVDWFYSGSHNLAWTPANVVGQKYYVHLLGHETGHHVLDPLGSVHIANVGSNGVPGTQSTYKEQYGYALMASTQYGNIGGSVIMAAYERDRKGWLTTEVLTGPSRTVTLGDLYTTARAAVLPLGTSGRKLYFANHQRLSYFDRLQYNAAHPAPYDRVAGGALASGLLATYTTGSYNIDVLPPDNLLKLAVWFDIPSSYGSYSNVNHYETDIYEPGKSTQITPWTRPNTSGFAGTSGTFATWAAVDSIRYTGTADSSMAFEYVEDFRTRPIIRADSWIGAETANLTIPGNLLIRDGADLDISVGSGNSITFSGTFTVNSGSVVTVGGVGQTITFEQGATINPGAQFVLRAGTTVELGTSANLNFWAPVSIVGTSGNPIRIQRSGASAWNQLTLLASGNLLQDVVLDGGTQNVVVASKNNTIRNVRSRNGWRNLSTWYDQATGGRSEVYIENSVFESATSVGVVMQHIDADLQNTSIRTSKEAGLYVTNAYPRLGSSLIDGNGTHYPRSGIEVASGGYVSLSDGSNKIHTNALHEVYLYYGAGAMLSMYNSIHDATAVCSSSERLVLNSSGSTVYADENYWGSASPSSSCFYSNVYARWPLTSDPTSSPGADGTVPNRADMEPVMVIDGGDAHTLSSTGAVVAGDAPPRDASDALRQAMRELRDQLAAEGSVEDAALQLRSLHGLMLRDHKNELGERPANLDVLRRWSASLSDKPHGLAREAAEVAATLEVWEALRADNYEEAARLVDQYTPLVQGEDVRQALQMQRVALLEHSGRFGEALRVIAEVREARAARARQQRLSEEVIQTEAALLRTREETIELLRATPLWPGEGQAAASSSPETNAAEQRTDEVPEEMTIAVQPNPFNGQTLIRYTLPEQTHVRVEVYDVMGRRVALVVNESQAAGTQEATFDGEGLSNGTYFYRITALGQTRTGTVLLVR